MLRFAKALLLAVLIVTAGCGARQTSVQTSVQKPPAPPPQAAPVRQPAVQTVQPAPAPAPAARPAPRWTDGVARVSPDGLAIRVEPTPSFPDGAARVHWTSPTPVTGLVAGLDQQSVMAVVDHESPGRTSGVVDAFRDDLERVREWRVFTSKAWPNG